MRGRKSTFTPEVAGRILEAVERGLPPTRAALSCGVPAATFCGWMQRNSEFANQVRQKEAGFERHCLGIVEAAAPKNWTAAGWILERRFGYRQNSALEVSGKDGGPVVLAAATINRGLLASLGQTTDTERVKKLD